MRTNLIRTFLAAVLTAAAAFAQGSATLQVNVPFDFVVGSQTLHGGQYSVNGIASGVVVVKSAENMGSAIAMGPALYSVVSRSEGRLVFHRCGNTYFLSEVWSPGNDGRQLPKTTRERELAANSGTPPSTIIAARR